MTPAPSPDPDATTRVGANRLIGGLLFGGTAAYLATLPRYLGPADESYFLLEAKRILGGEALYRDVFWFAMPSAHWVMALAFGAFGTTIRTARLTMAIVHATTTVLVYVACRRAGVRPALALVAPVAYVALCHAPWPYASPHWFGTLLIVLLLVVTLDGAWSTTARRAFAPGLVTGALATVHQHTGAAFALGMGTVLLLDWALGRRYGEGGSAQTVVARVLWFAAGVLAVVVPVLLFMAASAGVGPLFEQLIVFPLTGYRRPNRPTQWAEVNFLIIGPARYTVPGLLRVLPVIVPFAVVRIASRWRARCDRPGMRRLLLLAVLCCTSAVSVAYLADVIHVAFVATVFFVAWAEALETAVARLPGRAVARVAGAAVAFVLLGSLAVKLRANTARARAEYATPYDTAFGRIDFAGDAEIKVIEQVRPVIRDASPPDLFVYPFYTSLYLTTGATNPTPYQLLLPGFSSPAQIQHVLDILEARKVHQVVACGLAPPDDPVCSYVRAHYDCVRCGEEVCTLYLRRDETGAADARADPASRQGHEGRRDPCRATAGPPGSPAPPRASAPTPRRTGRV